MDVRRYTNLDNLQISTSFKDLLKWQKERRNKPKDLSFMVPRADLIELGFLQMNRKETSLTWIGHATFLLQVSGLNIITDPVWANRMGLEKRLAPPGIKLSDLPEIDIVLISHNHYDHLDFKSLRGLKGSPLFYIPEGLSTLFHKKGLEKTEEFCWWDRKQLGNVEFTFVPAQHWSKRTLWDANTTLWGGWIIRKMYEGTSDKKETQVIYFVGDSGYFRGFQEIGVRYKIDYLLIPIGAYEPEWFMSLQHLTPEQAVQAYIDSGAEYFIPMHYEAFRLGDDTAKEALERLETAWLGQEIDPAKLKILRLGETLSPSSRF